MRMHLLEGERKPGLTPNDVVSWGYLLTTSGRCGGLVSNRAYRTREHAKTAAERMDASLRKAAELNVRVINGERRQAAFHNEVVSWRFYLSTGARCPGIISNRHYKSYELAEAAAERMRLAILKHYAV